MTTFSTFLEISLTKKLMWILDFGHIFHFQSAFHVIYDVSLRISRSVFKQFVGQSEA